MKRSGKPRKDRVTLGYTITFQSPSEREGRKLIRQLLPVLRELDPGKEITGYYEPPLKTWRGEYVKGFEGGYATFLVGDELGSGAVLENRMKATMEMAKILDFPVTYAWANWFEGTISKHR